MSEPRMIEQVAANAEKISRYMYFTEQHPEGTLLAEQVRQMDLYQTELTACFGGDEGLAAAINSFKALRKGHVHPDLIRTYADHLEVKAGVLLAAIADLEVKRKFLGFGKSETQVALRRMLRAANDLKHVTSETWWWERKGDGDDGEG